MARDPLYRQAAPGYLGMVREGEAFRVIVGRAVAGAIYYRLQVRGPVWSDGSPEWVAVAQSSSASLADLVRKCGPVAPGLPELVEGLPEDPAKAAPWLWPMLAALAG